MTASSSATVQYVPVRHRFSTKISLRVPLYVTISPQLSRLVDLMDEAEIKSFSLVSRHQNIRFQCSHIPLVSLVFGSLQVVRPISFGHAFPYFFSTRVPRSVVELGRDDEDNVISY